MLRNCAFLFILILLSSCNNKEKLSIINKWKVEGFVKDNNSSTKNADDDLYFTFKDNKTISIDLDVNTCSGKYVIDKSSIVISDISCTEACCDSEFEFELQSLIPLVTEYYTTYSELVLSGENGLSIRFTEVE